MTDEIDESDAVPVSGMPETLTATQAAHLLGVVPRRVQQLAADGYIARAQHGHYVTLSVVQGYGKSLKDTIEANRQSTSQARVSDARARKIEMENAKAEHQLIDFDEAEAVVMEIAGMLKEEFSGFDASMTREPAMRAKIKAGIDGIFARVAERIAKTVEALGQSGTVVDSDAEDDA